MIDFSAQAMPGRRERQKRERRDRIEAAARAVFAEKGYDAATTREIAERADVSIGTLFAYAPDKRALLTMVFADALHVLTERSLAAVRPNTPVLDQLIGIFRPRFAFWGADPALARHAVRETMALAYDGSTPPEVELEAGLVALVRANQTTGQLDAGVSPALIARVILDIYLSENRAWLASERPRVATGVRRLRDALALALRGVVDGGHVVPGRLRL
jgi:AcrR family transcriptional regulator